jgi:hypothetical protein
MDLRGRSTETQRYWAQVSRFVFGATSHDVATYGFEDLQLYRELATKLERRFLPEQVLRMNQCEAWPPMYSEGGPGTCPSR